MYHTFVIVNVVLWYLRVSVLKFSMRRFSISLFRIDSINELNMSLKLGNLICAHADVAKFIYKTLDICSQRLFLFALRYTLPFLV